MNRVFLLLALAAPVHAQTTESQAIVYVRHLQKPDGGFAPSRDDAKSSLRATSSALRALKYLGSTVPERAKCVKFVTGCFDKATGGFTDRPGEGKPDVFTTAVGLMAVAELKLPLDDYAVPAMDFLAKHAKDFEDVRIAAAGLEVIGKMPAKSEEWRKLLAGMRNADGTYGKGPELARATGGAVAAQLRLGEKVSDRAAVLKALKESLREDGGYGKPGARTSDLETSYRVARAFVMLEDRPNAKKLKEFIERCRNEDGGFGVTPGAPSSVGGTYFAAILHHWLAQR